MQFQHGTFTRAANGSLILTPFAVDGRQLMSDPCKFNNAVYTRYNQPELFKVCIPISPQCHLFLLIISLKILANERVHPPSFKALRSLHRPLPRHPPPQPLQARRLPNEPHVPRFPPTPDASHANHEPDHLRHGHRPSPGHFHHY